MEIARHILGLERQRPPDLRKGPVECAARRQHADHNVGDAVQGDGTADHVRIGAELRIPQGVAEDRHMLFPQLLFVGRKRAAERRLDAENIEVMRRNLRPAQLNWLIEARKRHGAAGLRSHVLKDGVVFLPVQIIQRRNAVAAPARRFLQHSNDPFRFAIRQRLQQHAVHKTEDRGVGADSDGQRQDRHRGKPGTLPECPQSVAQILKHFVHSRLDDRLPKKFRTLQILRCGGTPAIIDSLEEIVE